MLVMRLVEHKDVALVSATGFMGRIVGPKVAERFGKSLLELGGNNAMILTPSADLDLALRGILFLSCWYCGSTLYLATPSICSRIRERRHLTTRKICFIQQ